MMRIILALLLLVSIGAARADELTCDQLLPRCGDGPSHISNQGGMIETFGGGNITNECLGIMNGVLASYRLCHGSLNWPGAAAVLIHFVHAHPEYMKLKAWDCAVKAYADAFPCPTQ